jgi:hypothetical protein
MARAYVDILTQLGREETPGTAVEAQFTLASLMMNFSPELDVKRYRAAGKKITTTSVLNRQWVTGNYEGGLSYNELVFILAGLIGAEGGAPAVVGTGGYGWTFNPKTEGADSPVTFTARRGDADAAQVLAQTALKSLEIASSREEVTASGNLVAQAIDNTGALSSVTDEVQALTKSGTVSGGTFTLTYSGQETANIDWDATAAEVQAALEALSNIDPGDVVVSGGPLPNSRLQIRFSGALEGTDVGAITVDGTNLTGGGSLAISTLRAGGASIPQIAESPVSGNEINIYVDTAHGSLGNTQIGCPFNFRINLPDRFNEKWCLNRSNPSFAETVAIATEPTISFDVEFNAQARALYDAVVQNSLPMRFIRWNALGANIGAGADYLINLDFAAKIRSCREVPDVDGVYAYTFEWDIVHSSAWGKAASFYVVNTLPYI